MTPKRLLWGAGGLVVLGVAVFGGVAWHAHREAIGPPPLGAHAAGVHRITQRPSLGQGIPNPPDLILPVPGSAHRIVALSLGIPPGDSLPGRAWLAEQPTLYTPVHRYTVRRGTRLHVNGLTITVLHVWREPDPAHDAVDIAVTPAG